MIQRVLLPPAAAALALVLQVGGGQAQTGPAPDTAPRRPPVELSETQKAELFRARRDLSLRTYTSQMAILQKGERCVRAARELEALLLCRREEGQARRELINANRQEARAVFERLGLPIPEGRKGQRRAKDS